MSLQNEMRRTLKRLRGEIESLSRLISINLDCGLMRAEELPIGEIDAQFDELKLKWGELAAANEKIRRLEEELS